MVLSADSWEALRQTHSRYFERLQELAESALAREALSVERCAYGHGPLRSASTVQCAEADRTFVSTRAAWRVSCLSLPA